jgi:hypothetical protein
MIEAIIANTKFTIPIIVVPVLGLGKLAFLNTSVE